MATHRKKNLECSVKIVDDLPIHVRSMIVNGSEKREKKPNSLHTLWSRTEQKNSENSHSIIHFPTYVGVSERCEEMSEK